jgi:hypothetical protein
VKKRGDRSLHGGTGARAPAWITLQVLIALVPTSRRYWRERATPPRGFILSPSATLRVAGLAPGVKVEHTTV